MRIPKQFKYRKHHKQKLKGLAIRCSKLQFGSFGLKALESTRITAQQIETVRQTIGRKIRPKGKLWIRVFPHFPVTTKPSEVRMGKGKGNVKHWVSFVKKGQILFEVSGVDSAIAKKVLIGGSNKLSILTKVISY